MTFGKYFLVLFFSSFSFSISVLCECCGCQNAVTVVVVVVAVAVAVVIRRKHLWPTGLVLWREHLYRLASSSGATTSGRPNHVLVVQLLVSIFGLVLFFFFLLLNFYFL